ncbi:MAG: hypothetical protein Roseis2KO_17910 [Roseivirga sp.]
MNKEVDIALLEGYLAGDIEASAVLDVDGNVLSEEALDLAIAEYKDILIHIEGAALKSRLQELQVPAAASPEKRSYKLWYAVAAAVVLVVVAGGIWQSMNRAPEFEDYFSHFDQLVSFRGDAQSLSASGIEAYSRKNYQEAFELLDSLDDSEISDDLSFYLAVSALGSGHVEEAIAVFRRLGMEESNRYYQQTRWYLALAYWQNDQVREAIKTMESIQAGEHKYTEAVELIERLR